MFNAEPTYHLANPWWRIATAFKRFQFLLPILVPTLFYVVAFALSSGLLTTSSVKKFRASFPQSYEVVTPISDRWWARGAIEVVGEGDAASVHVVVSHLTDYRARIIWLAATFTFLMVAIAAIATCGWIIWPSLANHKFRAGVAVYFVISLLLIGRHGYDLYEIRCDDFEDWRSHPDVLGMNLILCPFRDLDRAFQALAWDVHIALVVLLGIVMPLLAMAAAATLATPHDDALSTPALLAWQMQRAQIFLYTGCAVLTVGLVYVAIWNRWPVELLPKGDLRDDLAAYTTIVVAMQGVGASLMLLGAYVPTVLVQRVQARNMAMAGYQEEKQDLSQHEAVERFLDANRLRIPLYAQFQRFGAIFVPALVSPLISFLATLSGGSSFG